MKTFRIGGVHPHDCKLSASKAITDMELPAIATFPLSQHIGAPAVPVVKRGDVVKVGTKIAEAGGFVSAPIFSSVSGKVVKIDNACDASGYKKTAIIIEADGNDEWEEGIDRSDDLVRTCDLSPEDIIKKISQSGIVGMGGACFPTHVKLSPPPGMKAEFLIINGVECEPYLTADHRLMVEKTEEVLVGISLLMRAAKVEKAYVGIERNKPDAIQMMREKAAGYGNIEIVPLKMKYPQGGEKQLIDAILGRQVPPPPAIPISVGAVVQNVGTAFAVYEAVMKNKPLFERIVTVTGDTVDSPSNFKVRMGTPIAALIQAAGGDMAATGKVISGGPMMGKAVAYTDIPVCKGTSGVLLLNDKHAVRHDPQPCIRCAKCVAVCPMGLEPFLLATASKLQNWELVENESIMSCIECGSCQFTCPSFRPLLDYIRFGKNKVGAIIRSRNLKK